MNLAAIKGALLNALSFGRGRVLDEAAAICTARAEAHKAEASRRYGAGSDAAGHAMALAVEAEACAADIRRRRP